MRYSLFERYWHSSLRILNELCLGIFLVFWVKLCENANILVLIAVSMTFSKKKNPLNSLVFPGELKGMNWRAWFHPAKLNPEMFDWVYHERFFESNIYSHSAAPLSLAAEQNSCWRFNVISAVSHLHWNGHDGDWAYI